MSSVNQKIIAGSESLANLAPSKKIDTRGLVCPYPSFETSKLAGLAADADILEIITDDKYTASSSITSVLKRKQFDYLVLDNGDGTFSVKAKKQLS
ncbi:MAG: sulfurtransferase TusA family protein [Nitrososphaerota archaeon]|nr:sulfurtransferase TusA family protein [Nitrososphaerota archaeon]